MRVPLVLLVVLLPVVCPAERNRDYRIHAIVGAVNTRQVLRVGDETYLVSGFSARMHLVERVGYFVDLHLAPARVPFPAPTLFDWSPDPQDVLLAYFAVGPFCTWRAGPVDLTYRVGYGAVGDGRKAADLLLHGMTLGWPVRGRLYAAVDLRQALVSFSDRGAVSLTVGLGLDL